MSTHTHERFVQPADGVVLRPKTRKRRVKKIRTAARHETLLHRIADANQAKISVAVRYAFAMGRKALGKPPDADRAAKAVGKALAHVLPKTLHAVLAAGGEVAVKTLRAAAFNPDQPRDEQGRWTGTGYHGSPRHDVKEVSADPDARQYDNATSQFGAFFAESAFDAKHYAGEKGAIYSVELDLQKPYEMSWGEFAYFQEITKDAEGRKLDSADWSKRAAELIVEARRLRQDLEAKGHDAIIVRSRRGIIKEIASFKSQPVKRHKLTGLELRTAKRDTSKRVGPIAFRFDANNPHARDWADRHAAELIDGITETTREAINNAVAEHLETGDWEEFYDEILAAVGSEERADVIARTEVMKASNEGQRQAWGQAVEKGLLTGNEKATWIATPVNACPECEELDGSVRDLDGEYPEPGGEGPPLHPNCRCTEGLA